MTLDEFFFRAFWWALFLICLLALINFTDLPTKVAVTVYQAQPCHDADGTARCIQQGDFTK